MEQWERIAAGGEVALVMFRHGRTAWNAERRFLGRSDVPLDDHGRTEVAGLTERFRGVFDAIYSSPLARARQTADGLAPPPIRLVDALAELDQGEMDGLTGPEAIAKYPDFFAAFSGYLTDLRLPGGETLGEARDRALAAVRRIAVDHRPGERVAVVSHQMVIASLRCTLAGQPLATWRKYGLPNTASAVLSWDGRDLRSRD